MSVGMRILEGQSLLKDELDALEDATSSWNHSESLDMIFIFYAPSYNAQILADGLSHRFAKVPVVGCSTAGEWLHGQFTKDGLVMMGFAGQKVRWSTTCIDFQQPFDSEKAEYVVADLLANRDSNLNADKQFVLCMPDGTSGHANLIVNHMHDALHGVVMVGGSAGDNGIFEQTTVMLNGQVLSSGAVFVMGETALPFSAQLHQHFDADKDDVVVTSISDDGHIVYSLDGFPAVERYMELFDLTKDDLTQDVLEQCSLVYHNGDYTVANIVGKVLDDGGIWFYNSVEEGMLLSRSVHGDMKLRLEEAVNTWSDAQVVWVFNCCVRTGEWERKKYGETHAMLAPLWEKVQHFIGFDCYGEQYCGINQNQTLTVLLLGERVHAEE